MNRQGSFVKNNIGKASYNSFRPSSLQDVISTIKIDDEMVELLTDINVKIALLNNSSKFIECLELFLFTYAYKEALESSKIEGTQCTMENILSEEYIKNKNIDDIREVISNINAIFYAVDNLEKYPLCMKFFKLIHKELMKNVRGENKNPGLVRTTQNWIGGNNINDSKFVPPNVDDLNIGIEQLDKFLNLEYKNNQILINTALIHYQFETLHPFLDGNGRMGRIIILIYLMSKNLLSKPLIYISYFLKLNQAEYYDKLNNVRLNGDYEKFIKFFLICLREALDSSLNKMEKLEKLHNENLNALIKTNREKNTLKIVFTEIEKKPIFNIKKIVNLTNLSFNTVYSNIKKLIDLKIINTYNQNSRNKVFIYNELINIINEI